MANDRNMLICAGARNVFVSTEADGSNSNDNFALTAAEDGMYLLGVLCQNGWQIVGVMINNVSKKFKKALFIFCRVSQLT